MIGETNSRGLERAHLTRLPSPFALGDYEAASDEIVGRLQTLPGLVAIYRTGSVSAPGISDLDHIAVIEGERRVPDIWRDLSPRARYLAMHSPMLIDVKRFVGHRAFAHAEPLVPLAGKELAVEARPLTEYSEPLIAAEGIVSIVLRLAKQAVGHRVKVRPSLCEANSLRYDLELAGIDRRNAPKAWDAVDRVQNLREHWFQGDPQQVRPVLRAALEASLDCLSQLDAVLGERVRSAKPVESKRLRGPWKNVILVGGSRPKIEVKRRAAAGLSAGGRWGGGSELAWRLVTVTIALPSGVAGLLLGDAPAPYIEFRRQRDLTVRSYRSFMERRAGGYSMMGLGGTFL